MRPVAQTEFFRPEDHPLGYQRGNCLAACVASIFEVPLSQVEEIRALGGSQAVFTWTRRHYPGVRSECVYLDRADADPFDPEGWREWPSLGSVHNMGYWIATVYSYRIPDVMMTGCGCVERVPGGDPECEWCSGRPAEREHGMNFGTHAVVMRGDAIAWDPHPKREDGVGPIRTQTTWHVVDPALL